MTEDISPQQKLNDSQRVARSYDDLIATYRLGQTKPTQGEGKLMTFTAVPNGKDVYNPSGRFLYKNEVYLWGRVESRELQDAVAMLFKEITPTIFEPIAHAPTLALEDPFISWVGEQLIVGGVAVHKDEHGTIVSYRTQFFAGNSPLELTPLTEGPEYMKDIRLVHHPEQHNPTRIIVFTRPYIREGDRMIGRVGITQINSIGELTADRLHAEHTHIIHHLFAVGEWGGVNDGYVLDNGLIGALAHVSKFDEAGKRHYAAAVFIIDPDTTLISPLEVIAERKDFPSAPVKIMPEYQDVPHMHDDLHDVVFPSKLEPVQGSLLTADTVRLTCGLSDTSVGELLIVNPFPRLCRQYFPDFHTTI